MLVVEELYRDAVAATARKMIIFNGELDRIRSGCILCYCSIQNVEVIEVTSTVFGFKQITNLGKTQKM